MYTIRNLALFKKHLNEGKIKFTDDNKEVEISMEEDEAKELIEAFFGEVPKEKLEDKFKELINSVVSDVIKFAEKEAKNADQDQEV